jgi:hypothetical protein
MKRILLFVLVGISAFFVSCTGEDGIPGRDGLDGYSAESAVWETPPINFNQSNSYGYIFSFGQELVESDMILVYRLTRRENGTDFWKLCPETYYFLDGPNAGTLDYKYDYDFTKFDVNIVLDGFDRANLDPNIRNNQIFRIVAIPGYFVKRSNKQVNLNNYEEVIKYYGIDDSKVAETKN